MTLSSIKSSLLIVLYVVILSSCAGAYKQVAYLQNSNDFDADSQVFEIYDARIMPKDLITITVSTSDPIASAPFNLTVQTTINASTMSSTSAPSIQKYLVDGDGNINFPIVGLLHIGGLTKVEAEALIVEKLKPYINETPIVTVRMVDFKISVLGDVTKPGIFSISNERVTILEALAMAGDLSIYGERTNVKLIRENESGKREIVELNLNDANIISSPYFYMQQNDVLYITPNKFKAKTAGINTSTTIWFSVISSLLSFSSLMVTILL